MNGPDFAAELALRSDEKLECIEYIRDILGMFEGARQPLDHWERVHLVDSVSLASRGAYRLASLQAHLALTPEMDRNVTDYPLPTDDIYTRADLPVLRDTLRHIEAEFVRMWPHFGPVVITSPSASLKA